MLARGAMAGAKIARVIRIDSVRDGCDIAFNCETIQRGEKLVLAEVAALRIICGVARVRKLVRLDENMWNWSIAQKKFHLLAIMRGITCGNCRDAQRARAQRAPCRPREISRI